MSHQAYLNDVLPHTHITKTKQRTQKMVPVAESIRRNHKKPNPTAASYGVTATSSDTPPPPHCCYTTLHYSTRKHPSPHQQLMSNAQQPPPPPPPRLTVPQTTPPPYMLTSRILLSFALWNKLMTPRAFLYYPCQQTGGKLSKIQWMAAEHLPCCCWVECVFPPGVLQQLEVLVVVVWPQRYCCGRAASRAPNYTDTHCYSAHLSYCTMISTLHINFTTDCLYFHYIGFKWSIEISFRATWHEKRSCRILTTAPLAPYLTTYFYTAI